MSDTTVIQPDPAREESEKALREARVLRLRKDLWGGFAEAQRACQLDPRHVDAHDLTSELARELSLWEDALFHMEQAQFLDPDNTVRAAKLEKLRKDAEIYSRPVTEIVAEAREGGASWKAVFKSVFLRPDPIWYHSGWFRQALALAGLVLFVLLTKWVVTTGPWFFLFALLHIAMVAWVAYDAYIHGEPAVFWGPVVMFTSLFGFALYLTVRGMGSGIGTNGGGRFFSG